MPSLATGTHEPTTLTEALEACATVKDNGFTFVDGHAHERFISFHDLAVQVYRRAAGLHAFGLTKGQRIAVMNHTQEGFITTFLAAVAAGLVPVPVYPPSSLGRVEIWRRTTDAIFGISRPAAVVVDEDLRSLLWSSASRVDALLVTDRELDGRASPQQFRTRAAQPDDVAFLQFTSGSTSTPRGVVVTHRKIVDNCRAIMEDFLRPIEVHGVSWLPLYHDMGLIGCVLGPLLTQRPIIYLDTLTFLKKPKLWFELIDRHRATITFAPQFALALAVKRIRVDELGRWDLSCLRVVGCGAEPISAETLRSFSDHFSAAGLRSDTLCPSYGLAEATLMVTHHPVGKLWESHVVDGQRLHECGEIGPPTGTRRLEYVSCGTVIPGHQLRILDKSGQTLPDGAIGEIEVRGPCVTDGYFRDPSASSKTYLGGGLRTGDLGYLAGGRLFVTGRASDLVIIRGRNYSPQTIEWAVNRLETVRTGNVVAFANFDQFGAERLAVACEARTSDTAEIAQAVVQRVNEDLGLKVDDVLVLRPGALPKTSSGKVQRAKTRAMFDDGTLRRMEAVRRRSPLVVAALSTRLRIGWHSLMGFVHYRARQARRWAAGSWTGSK